MAPSKTAPAKAQAKKGKASTKKQAKAPAKATKQVASKTIKRHCIFYAEGEVEFVFRSLEGADRFVRSYYTPGSEDKDNLRPAGGLIYPVKEEKNVYIAEPPKKVSSRNA
jgi:hypothetical protein